MDGIRIRCGHSLGRGTCQSRTRSCRSLRSVPGRFEPDRWRLAIALAGRPGSRLAAALGLTVSRSVLLRLLRAVPLPAARTVRILGVDDFPRPTNGRFTGCWD